MVSLTLIENIDIGNDRPFGFRSTPKCPQANKLLLGRNPKCLSHRVTILTNRPHRLSHSRDLQHRSEVVAGSLGAILLSGGGLCLPPDGKGLDRGIRPVLQRGAPSLQAELCDPEPEAQRRRCCDPRQSSQGLRGGQGQESQAMDQGEHPELGACRLYVTCSDKPGYVSAKAHHDTA